MADGGMHPYDLRARAELMAAELGRMLVRHAARGRELEVSIGGHYVGSLDLGDTVSIDRHHLETGEALLPELEEHLRQLLADLGVAV